MPARRVAWYLGLALQRLRSDPRTFVSAAGRALRGALPARWRWLALGPNGRRRAARAASSVLPVDAEPLVRAGLVSVVLPVFDQADLLGDAVDSVLTQEGVTLELILLDDGSTDGVEAVLERAASDPRCRVVRQPNQGLPAALTHGFELARGQYLTWTSADNLLGPGMLRRLVAFLEDHPDVAMVYSDYLAIDGAGEPLRGSDFRPQLRASPDSAEIRVPRDTALLNVEMDNFIGPSFVYRGFVRRCLGGWRGALGVEDYDYWMRLNAAFRIEHLGTDETLYRYRWHDNSLNARARDIGLLRRGHALMKHEAKRARWRARPWSVRIDPALGRELAVPRPHRRAVDDRPRPAEDKRLAILAAETWLAERPRDAFCIVCWSGGMAPALRHGTATRAPNTLHAAFDADTAAALDVFTSRVLMIGDRVEPSFVELAIACADAMTADPAEPLPAPREGERPRPWGRAESVGVIRITTGSGGSTRAAIAPLVAELEALGQTCEITDGDGDWLRLSTKRAAVSFVPRGAAGDPATSLDGTRNAALVFEDAAALAGSGIAARDLPRAIVTTGEALPAGLARLIVWLSLGGEPAPARVWFRAGRPARASRA